MHKILVIRLYFPLEALHVSNYIIIIIIIIYLFIYYLQLGGHPVAVVSYTLYM